MATDPNLTNWQGAADDRLDFGKNAYLEAIPDLANANATAGGVSALQTRLAGTLGMQSQGMYGRMGKFNGMQDQYAADAAGYNSGARQDKVAGEAVAGVAQQFDNLKGQASRNLSRMGIDPGSGRALALNNQMQYAQASAQAGAANKARNDLDAVANERQKTAIGMGANLPTQATQAASTGALIGNAAVASAAAPVNNRLSFAGGINNIYGDAANDYKGLYASQNLTPGQQSTLAQQTITNDRADDAAFWSTLGSALNSKAGQSAVDKGLSWLAS